MPVSLRILVIFCRLQVIWVSAALAASAEYRLARPGYEQGGFRGYRLAASEARADKACVILGTY